MNKDFKICNDCNKCGLYKYTDNPKIKGRGNSINPKIVLVGEAPGPDENIAGIPFIGRAGKKLDSMIKSALDNNDVYITNMVKCFPPASTNNPTKGFRVPKETEIEYCKSFLIEELRNMANYPIIMTLGNVALFGLCGKTRGITKEAGTLRILNINNIEYSVIPNFHPSYILRNNNYEKEFKRIFNETYEG